MLLMMKMKQYKYGIVHKSNFKYEVELLSSIFFFEWKEGQFAKK